MNQLEITFQELAEKVAKLVVEKKRQGPRSKPEGRLSECGKFVVLKITKGQETLIDLEDFKRVAIYRWKASKPSKGNKFYAKRNAHVNKKERVLSLSRFIMNAPKELEVDHKNGDSLDNRKCNLRLCTATQNRVSFRSKNEKYSSKYRGVSKHRNKWLAQIGIKGKASYIGVFSDPIEAARARDKKALEVYGEFAQLNFP